MGGESEKGWKDPGKRVCSAKREKRREKKWDNRAEREMMHCNHGPSSAQYSFFKEPLLHLVRLMV